MPRTLTFSAPHQAQGRVKIFTSTVQPGRKAWYDGVAVEGKHKHHDKSVTTSPIFPGPLGWLRGEKYIIAKIVYYYSVARALGSRSKLNLLLGSRRSEMEDEWIVILLMNVMVVMRLMIRTICQQRIPRPSSTSSSSSSAKRHWVIDIFRRCEYKYWSQYCSDRWHGWLIYAVTDCDKDGDHKKSVPLSSNPV